MTDKASAAQCKRIRKFLDKWRDPMGLDHWRLKMNYLDEEETAETGDAQVVTFFEVHSSWKYCQAQITAFLPSVAQLGDEELEEYLVHELCHIHLQEMRPTKGQSATERAHEERVATQLARAFVWTRRAGQAERKRAA